jgi:hypothetical protein
MVGTNKNGIRGTALWGPVIPGPSVAGRSDEAPLSAAFIIFSAGREVARIQSDQHGHFEVILPAGDYAIIPEKGTPIPAPQSQKRLVTVPTDGFAEITLRFDSGMR